MNTLLKKIFINQPTKWGKGIPVLWAGMDINLYLKSFLINKNYFFTKNQFPFESARAAIYHYLKYKRIENGDEVIITCFTCDAVTKAVKASGAKIIYSDINDNLSMNFEDILKKINIKTKLIICQNSFGINGLSLNELKQINDLKIPVLLDNCLSFGTVYQKKYIDLFDAEVYSFEVSKVICIGWGGVIKINNPNNFMSYYDSLDSVPALEDLRRIFQTILNLLFVGKGNLITKFLWYFFMISGIFKKSTSLSKNFQKSKKLGKLSTKILSNVIQSKDEIFLKTKYNFDDLFLFTKKLGYKSFYESCDVKNILSCRLPLRITETERDNFKNYALKKYNLEIGSWFDDFPEIDISKNKFINTKNINSCIVNIPCYWSLKKDDFLIIKSFLKSYKN